MDKVTKDIRISDLVEAYPDAAPIVMSYGLHCIGCQVAAFETLEQGCKGHGMTDETIQELVDELNEFVQLEGGEDPVKAEE
ncbi:DUF1858 domain-containing protein [Candidatus Woesearchaeota archaeon]|nr:DUF1858 domain-containing protein [Candidatus Woesearchaeota archaeon]